MIKGAFEKSIKNKEGMTELSDVTKRANLFSNKTGFLYGIVKKVVAGEYQLEISTEEGIIENRKALEELIEGMNNSSFDHPYYILSVEGEASFHVDFINRRFLNQGTLSVDLKKNLSSDTVKRDRTLSIKIFS